MKKSVKEALENNVWITWIDMTNDLSVDHIQEFYHLWEMLSVVQLDPDSMDTISWKFPADGRYTTASAYDMQFAGLAGSPLKSIVWKI